MKTLIAYFSRADENYFGGAMRYVKVGNTEIVANIMKDLTGADMFKINMKDLCALEDFVDFAGLEEGCACDEGCSC